MCVCVCVVHASASARAHMRAPGDIQGARVRARAVRAAA